MSVDQWALLMHAVTLFVITTTAIAALVQLPHLRAQNALNAELPTLKGLERSAFQSAASQYSAARSVAAR